MEEGWSVVIRCHECKAEFDPELDDFEGFQPVSPVAVGLVGPEVLCPACMWNLCIPCDGCDMPVRCEVVECFDVGSVSLWYCASCAKVAREKP
jgi:hypothetical protein